MKRNRRPIRSVRPRLQPRITPGLGHGSLLPDFLATEASGLWAIPSSSKMLNGTL